MSKLLILQAIINKLAFSWKLLSVLLGSVKLISAPCLPALANIDTLIANSNNYRMAA
jgi:hypothetical protein